jgi:hypothetical protein
MTNIAEQRNLDNIGFKISSKNAKLFQRKDIPVVIFPEEVEPAFWNVLKIDNKMKDLKQKKKEEKSKKGVVESTSPFFRMSNFKSKRFAGKPKQNNETKSDNEKVETKDRQSPPSKIETLKKTENSKQNVRHSPPSKTQMVENETENKARHSPPSKSEKTERKGLKRKPDFEFETADKRSKLSDFDSKEVISSKKDEPTIKDSIEKKRNGLQQEPTSFNKSRQDSSSSSKSQQDSTGFSKSRQDSTSFSKSRLDSTSFKKSQQDSTSLNKMNGFHSKGLKRKSEMEENEIDQTKKSRADGKITSEYFESFENEVDYNTDEYNRHTNGDNRNKDVENRHTNVENRDKTEEHRSKHKEEYYRKISDDEYRSKNKDERHANVENGNKDVEHRSKHKEEHRKMSEEYRSKKRDKTEAKRSSKESRKKENFSGVKGFCLDCDGCEVGCQHFDHSRILFRDLEVHQRINANHTRFQPVNITNI